jgi:sugar (pentulose or hexulose) kinase
MVGYGGAQEAGHVFRAALEGVALLAREGAGEVMERVARVVVSGGPVRSRPVRRIMAAVFGGRVLADESGHSGVGAAILAGFARGKCRSLDRNVLNTCKQTGIVEADAAEVEFYARLLPRFRDIRKSLHTGDTGQ